MMDYDNIVNILDKTNFNYINPCLRALFGVSLIAFMIIYSVLLPLYIYTNKVNHERDKEILIYPITKHFCQMVKISYLIFVFAIIILSVIEKLYLLYVIIPLIVFFCFGLFILLYTITQVFHVLIFVLAIERFFLYLSPSSEKIFKPLQKRIRIRILYYLIVAKNISCFIYSVSKGTTLIETHQWAKFFYWMTCFTIGILVFISTLFYIPIIISIRKFVNLQSAQRSKPHKYIMLQTIVVFIFKPIHVLVYFMASRDGDLNSSLFIYWVLTLDFITTPLIIQTSYLSCNKRNMNLLFSSFSVRKLFSVLFNLRTGATVLPRAAINYSTN